MYSKLIRVSALCCMYVENIFSGNLHYSPPKADVQAVCVCVSCDKSGLSSCFLLGQGAQSDLFFLFRGPLSNCEQADGPPHSTRGLQPPHRNWTEEARNVWHVVYIPVNHFTPSVSEFKLILTTRLISKSVLLTK